MPWTQTTYEDFDAMGWVQGPIWRGSGEVNGYFLWYAGTLPNSEIYDEWLISSSIGFDVKVNDSTCTGYWYVFNGKRYWKLSSGKFLWWSVGWGKWIISSKLGCCTREEWSESTDDSSIENESSFDSSYIAQNDSDEYIGDEWWSSSTFEGFYDARGSLRGTVEGEFNGIPKFVEWTFSGYRKDYGDSSSVTPPTSFGISGLYKYFERELDIDSSSSASDFSEIITSDSSMGYLDIGVPIWVDQNGTEYQRSLEKEDGYFTYGNIYYDGSGWVIGTRDSSSGWWEGSEPIVDDGTSDSSSSSVTFSFIPGSSSSSSDDDLEITFDRYVVGDNITTIYIGETALWV